MFNAVLCGLLGLCSFALKLQKKKEDDADPVLQSIGGGALIFTIMICMKPDAIAGMEESPDNVVKTFLLTCFQTVLVIFLTGPIKVWLDVKRGKTSLVELRDNLQDSKSALHESLGVNRGGVLPETDGPRRR